MIQSNHLSQNRLKHAQSIVYSHLSNSRGGWNKREGWKKSKKLINVEGGFLFCGGWNFSKSVSMGPTFIREMRVDVKVKVAIGTNLAKMHLCGHPVLYNIREKGKGVLIFLKT